MQSKKQAFATLTEELRNALAQGDWNAVTALDEDCRSLVAALRDEDAFDSELRVQIDALASLYEELQQSGRAERERLAGELTRLNQSKQVDQAYKTFD
ncbi:flagellar protein FliT [Pseudomonas saudiphocaensis]|uniref:flagellar protein FliT n=1 Tax=Pseudomonas saudiphocaensis TaxID=1499686 RepID=UPI000F78CC1F|nr:flagellar protein FliT [Pseudomonas saudiphocaensis]RRV16104.1 flagellar protein FliT [Pseudomonas saudiphocaensis]